MTDNLRIREIQAEYFDIVDLFFGKPYSEMKKNNVSAVAVAGQLAEANGIVKAFRHEGEKFAEGIGLRDLFLDTSPPSAEALGLESFQR